MKLSALVAALLALTLTACGQKAAEAPAAPAVVVETPAATVTVEAASAPAEAAAPAAPAAEAAPAAK